MKLYKFTLTTGLKSIEKTVYEARETPKMYILENSDTHQRIYKDFVINGVSLNRIFTGMGSHVFLLEDDIEKARTIFINEYHQNKSIHEYQIQCSKNAVAELDAKIKTLEELDLSMEEEVER